jgi:hypothetical protein
MRFKTMKPSEHFAAQMPIILKCALLAAFLGLCFNFSQAQKVRFSISSESITTDDAVQVTMELSEVSGSVAMPRFPDVKGLANGGNSTNQNYINGRVSVAFSRTYVPQAAGNYKIPSFSYSVAGKTFQSPEFALKVSKGSGKAKQQQRQVSPFDAFFGGDPFNSRPKEELKFQETKADYFLSINLDKDSCYVGEQVRGEVVLYINERDYGKINLDGRDIVEMQQKIKNSGFWQEIIEFEQVPVNRTTINGKRYVTYTLYQTILFPIKSGKIEFKGIDLGAKKLHVATNASIMDAMMGHNQKYEPIRIKANERSLMVRELPRTELPNANMVGKFKMDVVMPQNQAQTGDNLELQVKISGNGNIAMMDFPNPNFPASFRLDGVSNDFSSKTSANGFSGEKLYKYYLVPTKPGAHNLGPIKFYFFDPKARNYDSIFVADVPVAVTGAELADKLMQNNGMDNFYDESISKASTSLQSNGKNVWLFWALGMLVLVGSLAIKLSLMIVSRRKKNEKGALLR